ncbi:MAG TPA: translocation/assembly module TamB domain-containing protein, partial [Gemmatimonadales bacterium]|nr:translocation/assembly module TamB domain-containing protein [Gemmatimonadales bacterium]
MADVLVRELAATLRPSLTAQIRLGAMRVAGRRLRGANLTASWSRDRLSVQGGVVGPGRVQLAGTVGPLNSKAKFEISRLGFVDLDLSGLLPRVPPTGLTGELAARGQVGSLRRANVTVQLSLSRSRLGRYTLAGGAARVRLGGGQMWSDLELRTDAARAHAQVEADVGALARHWRLAGVVDGERLVSGDADAASAARALRIAIRIRADGAGLNPRTAHASVDLAGTARVGKVQVDSLAARVRLRGGELTLDTVLARARMGELGASGTIALGPNAGRSELRVHATSAPPTDSPAFPGLADTRLRRATLDLRAAGPPSAIRLDARARAIALRRRSTSVDSLSVHGTAELAGRRAIRRAEATIEAAGLHAGAFTAPRARVQAGWDGRTAAIAVRTGLGPQGELAGAADVVPAAESLLVRVRDLAVQVGRDRWTLTRKPTIVLAEHRIAVDELEARSGAHRVALAGSLDRAGPVRLHLTAHDLPIGVALGQRSREALDARLDANVDMSGDAASPVVVARADASVVRSDSARGKPDSTASPVRLRGTLRWAGDSLALKADLLTRSDSTLAAIRGTLPLALSLATHPPGGRVVRVTQREVALALDGDRVDLAIVPRFVSSRTLAGLRGSAMVHARVEGPIDRPNATGEATVRDASLKLPSLGVVYEQIGLRARLASDGRVELDSARMVSSSGELTSRGTIDLRRAHFGELNLGVALRDFRFIDTDARRLTASGDVQVQGTPRAPVLRGPLEIRNSSVTIGRTGASNAKPVDLGPADLQMLRDYFGDAVLEQPRGVPDELYRAAALDLDVTIGRGNWIRHLAPPRFQLELAGRIRARKPPNGELSLEGAVEPVAGGKSEIEQYGRRFELTEGKATFDGPLSAARFDLGARHRTTASISAVDNRKDVTVRARVRGTMDSLDVALTSEPPMAQSDIVSYLVTGVAETQTFSAQEAQQATAAAATNVATAAAASSLAEAGRQATGLDVVRIQQDGRHGTTLVAGQYVAPRVYVGFRQPMVFRDDPDETSGTGAQTTFEAEYAAFEWLVTNAQGASDRLRVVLR